MPSLPIEHAWKAMVAGMHIHEHFLEVWPATQERRGRPLYDHYRAAVDPQVPPLESLRARFPDAFLEHCYRQAEPASLSRIWRSLRFAHIAASVASTAVLIVDEDDCLAGGGAGRVADVSRLPGSARRLDPTLQRDVTSLIEAAGLTYLVQLNIKVLIRRAGREAPVPEPVPDHRGFLYGTCDLYPDDGPFTCAEHLLAGAAAHWMYCFLLARPDPSALSPRTWLSPWSGQPADSIAMAMQMFTHCIRLEFLEGSLAQGEVAISDSCRRACLERMDQERLGLQKMEEFVRDLDASFSPPPGSPSLPYNNLSVCNLLNSHYPGPRQFGQYLEGGGMGQYERS